MRDRKIILVGAASMMAKVMEQPTVDARIGDELIEFKTAVPMDMGCPDFMEHGNRAERRSYGSKRKHLKGLRP